MQDSDDGFTSYMAAHWPILVRSLVTLGCEPHEAEDVAQTALARCYASWGQVCRATDVDAYVFRTMLNVWNKSRRRRWWSEKPLEVLPENSDSDELDRAATRDAIEQALGNLSPKHRAVLTLRFVADLSEQQTARVPDVPQGFWRRPGCCFADLGPATSSSRRRTHSATPGGPRTHSTCPPVLCGPQASGSSSRSRVAWWP
jgi:RNA polymerase sigma factor (sigma-70 family)